MVVGFHGRPPIFWGTFMDKRSPCGDLLSTVACGAECVPFTAICARFGIGALSDYVIFSIILKERIKIIYGTLTHFNQSFEGTHNARAQEDLVFLEGGTAKDQSELPSAATWHPTSEAPRYFTVLVYLGHSIGVPRSFYRSYSSKDTAVHGVSGLIRVVAS